MNMQNRKGSLSIESENMFPIIKKWLYSDHDIFIRELISNGCDAITKLKKLDIMGEYTLPDDFKPEIQVVVDTEGKTISFTDTGLGMTEEEVDEYINQVAFSGATDFLEKYKDKTNEEQIIGHFGLGFYSAFMVADSVSIDTLSWKKGQYLYIGSQKAVLTLKCLMVIRKVLVQQLPFTFQKTALNLPMNTG